MASKTAVPRLSNIALVETKFWPRCSENKWIPNKLGTRKISLQVLHYLNYCTISICHPSVIVTCLIKFSLCHFVWKPVTWAKFGQVPLAILTVLFVEFEAAIHGGNQNWCFMTYQDPMWQTTLLSSGLVPDEIWSVSQVSPVMCDWWIDQNCTVLCICLFLRGRYYGHFLLMNVDINHAVEARTSQWLPFSMRWPNEKIQWLKKL